ncbi:MAG: triose-phosphate isomerase [Alphaproteobacteria bacterium]|nr:triose-phosphate isomerase [Alphaproteobacteria bacterium]
MSGQKQWPTQYPARRAMVVGNWKMHGDVALTRAFAAEAARQPNTRDSAEVILAPPVPFLDITRNMLSGMWSLAAQDCHWAQSGAYTGEISAEMLAEFGCGYVIVGHSERRILMGETDEYVQGKIEAALAAGLTPIMCIGETLAQHQAQETFITLASQLYHGLPSSAVQREVVIAYEPVWAIGSGLTPTPEEVQDCHDHIRTFLCTHWNAQKGESARVLYGGSVKPDNVADFLTLADVDGVLVGGASLDPTAFADIVRSAFAL